jgi:hypothetical protein
VTRRVHSRLLNSLTQWTGGYSRSPHGSASSRKTNRRPQTAIMQNSPSPRRSSVTTSPRPRVSPGRAPRASTAPAGQTPRSLRLARSQVHQATIETAPGQPGFSPDVSPVAALPFTDSLPRAAEYALLRFRGASDHAFSATRQMSSVIGLDAADRPKWVQLDLGGIEASLCMYTCRKPISHTRTRLFSHPPILACARRSLKPPQPDFSARDRRGSPSPSRNGGTLPTVGWAFLAAK